MSSVQQGSAEERAWAATTEEAAEVRRQRVSELESLQQPQSFLDSDAQHRPAGTYQGTGGNIFSSIKESTSSLLSAVKEATVGSGHEASAEERSLNAAVVQGHRDRTPGERFDGSGEEYTVGDAARDAKNEEEQMIGDAARRTKDYVGKKKDQAMFTLKDLPQDANENVQDRRSDDEKYTLRDAAGDAKNFAAEAKDDEESVIDDSAKKTKEYAGDVKDQAKNTMAHEKDMVKGEAEKAKDYVGDKKDRAKDQVHAVKENADEAKEDQERMAGDAAQRTREFAGETKDQAANTFTDTAQRIKGYAGEKKDQVMGSLRGAKDSAGEVKDGEERMIGDAAQRSRDTLKGAKDYAIEAKESEERMIGDAAQRTKDYVGDKKDRAMDTLKESKDSAADAKNDAEQMVGGASENMKGYVGEKKDEGKHMASDHERNVNDDMADRRGGEEGKRTMIDSARGAMDYLSGKKEELRKSLAGDAKTRMGQTPESVNIRQQIVKEREKEREIQNWEEFEQSRDVGERGSDASSNIYGAWPVSPGSVVEAFKQKMTMLDEVVEQKRAEQRRSETGDLPAKSP